MRASFRSAVLTTLALLSACATGTRQVEQGAAPEPAARAADGAVSLALPTSEGYVQVSDSVRLFYRTVGSRPDTVVVVHGGPGFPSAYLDMDLRPLALSHTLLFYDQRGAGNSTLVTDTAQLHSRWYAHDLEALRRHFGLERMTLMGHSWGGVVAGLYALEHPERVERMVLYASSPPADRPYRALFRPRERLDSLTLAKLDRARQAWGSTPDSTKKCWDYYGQLGEGYTFNPAYARQTWGDVCDAPPQVMRNPGRFYPLQSLGDYDWTDRLQRLTFPVLVIHGVNDPLPVEGARHWAKALPNAQLVEIEEAGHFLAYERPEVFFPVVDAFLNKAWPVPVQEVAAKWPPAPGTAQGAYARAWWEISTAHDRLEAAIAAQDAGLATEGYTEDALFFAPTAPPLRGHRQLRAFFQDMFSKGVRSASFETLDLEGDDETRIESGRYTLRGGNGEILDMGKYLVVWKKQNGRWRAHRDIFNTSMETPSPLYEYDLNR